MSSSHSQSFFVPSFSVELVCHDNVYARCETDIKRAALIIESLEKDREYRNFRNKCTNTLFRFWVATRFTYVHAFSVANRTGSHLVMSMCTRFHLDLLLACFFLFFFWVSKNNCLFGVRKAKG